MNVVSLALGIFDTRTLSAYLQTVYALDKKSGGFQSYILKMHEFSSDEDGNVWQVMEMAH